jgi:CheY-like chemotaxis protein
MQPIHILLVEDNEGDILLTTEAFEDAKIHVKLSVVKDGMEAIDFVNKQGRYKAADQPDLVLLDVNLPKKNGHEVLKYIKENETIKHIPVIMLTTSSAEKDINRSYNNYVNCYITKPVEVDDFMKVVSTIEDFWISIVKLPTRNFNPDDKR